MSNLEELDKTGVYSLESPTIDEKNALGTYPDSKKFEETNTWRPSEEWLERLKDEYSGKNEQESLPPGCDPDRFAAAILTMDPTRAVQCLVNITQNLDNDYTFDLTQLAAINDLIQGAEHCNLSQDEWSYQVSKKAGVIHNWSAYLEVRSCTLPYDDVDEPCESFRAYTIGFFWIIVMTAVNTCEQIHGFQFHANMGPSVFAPRQPTIAIPNQFAQLVTVPMGRSLALILPHWGFTWRGHRYQMNSGKPWSAKEQLFCTVLFTGSTTIGNFTGLLDLRLPVFFGQEWANYGFCLLCALANQMFGLGAAGILRRLTVYPSQAVWPSNLPTIALTRALVNNENVNEMINGWKIRRIHFFFLSCLVFGIYYWIPNELFLAIRNFNWMTWGAPNNYKLAVVTGGFGGFGFNPISSLDFSTFGFTLQAPFFAQMQQYILRVFGGIVILAMYFSNAMWSGYLPANSNAVFDRFGQPYNYSKVINYKEQTIDLQGYQAYGPPYYTISNLFVTGGNYVFYTFSLVYIFTKYRKALYKCFVGMAVNMWKRQSIYTGFDDGAIRMMRRYPEVPEWWYSIVFVFGFVITLCSLVAFPTQTPWWTVLILISIGGILTVPWVLIQSIADTGISLNVIWQVLPGALFPGNPLAQLMLLLYGGAFEQIAGGFTADLKYSVYARIPPRAIFRGHCIAQAVNCIIYCAMVNVMLVYANSDGTLCTYKNPQFMVCSYANSVYSSTIEFGAFGSQNMFQLYPVMPWCFLIGAALGAVWLIGEYGGPAIRRWLEARMEGKAFVTFDNYIWKPTGSVLAYVHPAVALNGMLQWSGNTNLTQATGGIILAWYVLYYLKRYYPAWWQKYAYLGWSGISVGNVVSGLIITLTFSFGAGQGKSLKWWGNDVQQKGWDYQLYNNNGSYLPLPEKGYFGLDPDQFPSHW